MNRKQGQSSSRNSGSSSLSGRGMPRSNQFAQNSQYGQNYGHSFDQDDEMQTSYRQGQAAGRNFSGTSSYDDDSYESGIGADSRSSLRDTDYDLDNSTYGGVQNRASQRSLSGRGTQGDYELSDRYNRDQTRFSSSLDDNRMSRPTQRYNQSSERFGYPSSMNSWRGNDRSTGAGARTGAGRVGQSSWGASEHDEDTYSQGFQGSQDQSWRASEGQYYGEGSLGSSYNSDRISDRGHFGKGPKGWKRSDDRIKEDVCETLARNSRIDASDIDVKVEDACVTLSGTVESKEIKRAAEMAIENLSGVDDVRNEIKVKKMGERGMDSTIHASSSGASASTGSTSSKSSSKNTSHL
jgi:osmotically-inducible protein OsmY